MTSVVNHINTNANPINCIGEMVRVRAVIALDPVSGAWDKPEDYINHMFRHLRYIQGASVINTGNRDVLYAERSDVIGERKKTEWYDQGAFSKHVEIIFDVQMDGVPGRFNQAEDFIDYLIDHSYAKFAEQVKIIKS